MCTYAHTRVSKQTIYDENLFISKNKFLVEKYQKLLMYKISNKIILST